MAFLGHESAEHGILWVSYAGASAHLYMKSLVQRNGADYSRNGGFGSPASRLVIKVKYRESNCLVFPIRLPVSGSPYGPA
jgi:hypothetical protein